MKHMLLVEKQFAARSYSSLPGVLRCMNKTPCFYDSGCMCSTLVYAWDDVLANRNSIKCLI